VATSGALSAPTPGRGIAPGCQPTTSASDRHPNRTPRPARRRSPAPPVCEPTNCATSTPTPSCASVAGTGSASPSALRNDRFIPLHPDSSRSSRVGAPTTSTTLLSGPVLILIGDADGTRVKHAVEIFSRRRHLRWSGPGAAGPQLAILPGPIQVGMLERAGWNLTDRQALSRRVKPLAGIAAGTGAPVRFL
jgi:hypothetical protein